MSIRRVVDNPMPRISAVIRAGEKLAGQLEWFLTECHWLNENEEAAKKQLAQDEVYAAYGRLAEQYGEEFAQEAFSANRGGPVYANPDLNYDWARRVSDLQKGLQGIETLLYEFEGAAHDWDLDRGQFDDDALRRFSDDPSSRTAPALIELVKLTINQAKAERDGLRPAAPLALRSDAPSGARPGHGGAGGANPLDPLIAVILTGEVLQGRLEKFVSEYEWLTANREAANAPPGEERERAWLARVKEARATEPETVPYIKEPQWNDSLLHDQWVRRNDDNERLASLVYRDADAFEKALREYDVSRGKVDFEPLARLKVYSPLAQLARPTLVYVQQTVVDVRAEKDSLQAARRRRAAAAEEGEDDARDGQPAATTIPPDKLMSPGDQADAIGAPPDDPPTKRLKLAAKVRQMAKEAGIPLRVQSMGSKGEYVHRDDMELRVAPWWRGLQLGPEQQATESHTSNGAATSAEARQEQAVANRIADVKSRRLNYRCDGPKHAGDRSFEVMTKIVHCPQCGSGQIELIPHAPRTRNP